MNKFLRIIILVMTVFFVAGAVMAVAGTNITKSNQEISNIVKQAIMQLVISIGFIIFVILTITTYKKIIIKLKFLNNKWARICFLVSIAFVLRMLCFILFDIMPRSDFAMYNKIAINLANNNPGAGWYGAVFPHVIGYPLILSALYKIVGVYKAVAVLLNILISTLSVLLVYIIASKLKNNWKHGLTAGLVYTFFPTTILYTSLVATETIFTFLLLLSVMLFVFIVEKKESSRITLISLYSLLAVVCGIANSIRPFGLVLIIAFLIMFILNNASSGLKKVCIKTSIFAVVFIGCYFILYQLNGSLSSKLISREIAKSPYGFNLFIGSNMNHNGMWNSDDAAVLDKIRELPPQKVHDILFEKALKRYKNNGIGNIKLYFAKFGVTWGVGDSGYVAYAISGNNGSVIDLDKYGSAIRKLCCMYYITIMLLCSICSYRMFRKREYNLKIILIFLIILGVVFVHLITEAMGRYNFPVLALMSIIAVSTMVFKETDELVIDNDRLKNKITF